jgi:hypothetical protein
VKLDRKNTPRVYQDLRPLSQARLARGEAGEEWRLWMLVISFGFIIAATIFSAAVGS